MLRKKNFFSKNFEALHRDSAKRYGDSADEIFAGVEACDVPMGTSSMVPRQLQLLFRKKGEGMRLCFLLVRRVESLLDNPVSFLALSKR